MNFKSENNCADKKVLSKTVINLIIVIIILVTGIGFLTNYYFVSQAVMEKNKSIYINLMNKNTELMNENIELTEKLSETRSELETTKNKLWLAKSNLEKATFELGEDMLTLPMVSPQFDCDDSALYMYLYFKGLGYDVDILSGNLDLDNETYWQTNHIWVWVDGGIKGTLAYDWGYYRGYYDGYDKQHFYGYALSYRELLEYALRDQ